MLVMSNMVTHRGLVRARSGGKRRETERYIISLSTIRHSIGDKAVESNKKDVAFFATSFVATRAQVAVIGDS